ncbi:MAG: hypothetical protein AAF648_08665 [Pseudomonadota bacterium]
MISKDTSIRNRRLRKQALSITAAAAIASTQAFADADIAVQPAGTGLAATANVDLRVVVPEILIFGVGAVGDAIAELQWTLDNAAAVAAGNNQTYSGASAPFTAPAPLANTATAAVVANGGTGATALGNQAELPVFLFSNAGTDVTITTTVGGGATGAGTVDALDNSTVAGATIPIASFTGGDGGGILQPALSSTASAATANVGGIVNLTDTWTYSYSPASIPPAGTYQARVTYVAATP